MAGIIVGIVALPLAIAFGIASGVSPEKGLITAILGGFIVSFLGGSNVQIGGPTGAFIVIVAGIISQYGIEGLAIATVMAGIILVLLGLFKLGVVIKFIPLSHHRGLHGWYCPDDILHPDKRPLRSTYRRSRPGRLHRQMGGLLPALRHHQPLGPRHRPGEHPHHSADAQGIAQDTGVARGHHPRYRRLPTCSKGTAASIR